MICHLHYTATFAILEYKFPGLVELNSLYITTRFYDLTIRNFLQKCFSFIFRKLLSIPRNSDGFDRCSMYNVNFTEVLSQGIKEADPSWEKIPCQYGWEYNFTDVPYRTIASDVNILLVYNLQLPLISIPLA